MQDVKESEKFAVIVDETADVSKKEQVSVCLSYIAKELRWMGVRGTYGGDRV